LVQQLQSLYRPWLAVLLASLLVCAGALPSLPAQADVAGEAEYRTAPNAAAAEKAARAWLAKGNLGRAINWVERMVRSPGATAAQQSWAAKVRADLRWQLVDLGLGPLAISVIPSSAEVSIDGKDLLPRTGNYLVWLQEGSHQLLIAAEDHAPLEQLVAVVRGEKRSVEARLTLTRPPKIKLQVTPLANLWIDGKALGSTGRDHVTVTPGPHLVELRAAGHRPWIGSLDLVPGQVHVLQIQLEPDVADGAMPGRTASDVRRPVTAQEKVEGAERSPDMTREPDVATPSGPARGKMPASGAKAEPENRQGSPTAAPSEPNGGEGPAAAPEAQATLVDQPAAPSEPWSDTTKGWLLGGAGLGLAAGGAVYAILASQDAEAANRGPYGDPGYREAYEGAANRAFVGYGVAGAGALISGWGSYYLFGNQGLSRSGRGWLLTATGLATAGAGGWLASIAAETLSSAADFSSRHPEYDRRVALGERDLLISYGVAGAGVVLVGAGIWQWLGSSSPALARVPGDTGSHWALMPQVSPGHSGAIFTAWW
jgi:hypothetical protein